VPSIQNFYTSRDNNTDGNTYVGQLDRLWYNPNTNSIFVSDGVTAGGNPVALATGANITANNITVNTITSTSGTVTVTGNLTITGNISPASNVKIGGIVAGPGVNISNTGLLTIDSANLPVSFGNFAANNNILSIVNVDENMVLATQGNAEIQLVGNIGFYKSNGLPPSVSNRYFFARNDGQLRILVPVEDPLEGGIEIIGSATGNFVTPGAPGSMLQMTGNPDVSCRVYQDSLREYSSYVARRYNGTTASPGQVLAGEDVFRINATAATNAGMGNVALAQMRFTAIENQTTTAQGSNISFYVTAIGSAASARVEAANISVANGVSATKFTTGGTVSATGNVTAGNLVTAGTVSATGNIIGGNLITSGLFSVTGNITGGNLLTAGLITATGNITGGNISTGGALSVTGNITAGNVNSFLTLPAGTAAQSPLLFAAGNIQIIPPTAGSMSYDGTVFYATPQDAERGLVVSEQLFIPNADYPLINQTGVQNLFGAITTVSSNTRYAYRIMSTVYKVSNNISLQYAMGGNAVVAKHTYQTLTTATSALATASAPLVVKNVVTTGFATPVTVSAALNGTGYYGLTVTGTLNVTTAGTWYPEIAFTGLPGVGSNVFAGSSIEIWPIGPAGANVSIGNWS
jgi:hypothetical protein